MILSSIFVLKIRAAVFRRAFCGKDGPRFGSGVFIRRFGEGKVGPPGGCRFLGSARIQVGEEGGRVEGWVFSGRYGIGTPRFSSRRGGLEEDIWEGSSHW